MPLIEHSRTEQCPPPLPGGPRALAGPSSEGRPSRPSAASAAGAPRESAQCSRAALSGRERFNDNRTYERFKSDARRLYQRCYGPVADQEWDAAFNMSYWKLYQLEMRSPGQIAHPVSWIVTAAKNEIISDHRRVARQAPLDDADGIEDHSGREDAFSKMEQHHLLRDVSFILKMLPARQRRVWSSRFVWDYHPQEIQHALGISRKAYEKALAEASTFLLGKLEHARQGVCDTPEMQSLIRGYAVWGERHYSHERGALARAHLEDCLACRHTAWVIRHQATEQSPEPRPATQRRQGGRVRTGSRTLARRPERVLA